MEFTEPERAALLRALFELSVSQWAFDADPDRDVLPIVATIPREQIVALVVKLGGDPDAPMFVGASTPYERPEDGPAEIRDAARQETEYPGDETDEG